MDINSQDRFSRTVGNSLSGTANPENSSRMSDEEVLSAMNVPPRDELAYPDVPESDQVEAGAFLQKLNLVAATYDGNLRSLLWEFYRHLSRYLTAETKAEDLIALVGSLDSLKEYLFKAKNPIIFPEDELPEGGPGISNGGQ